MRGLIRHVFGWGLVTLGVAGIFLPILQGWLFIALGALLLSPDVPFFARLLAWTERRFPGLKPTIHRVRVRLGLDRG